MAIGYSRQLTRVSILIISGIITLALSGGCFPSQNRPDNEVREHTSSVSLVTDRYYQRLGRTTTYVRDPSHKITIDDLMQPSGTVRFERNDSPYLSFGLTTDAFWMKVRIKRPVHDSRPYLIELQNSMLESVDFYHVRENQILETFHIERTTPPDARPFHHPNYVIPLRLQAGESGTFFIRVLSREAVNIPLFLWSQTDFNRVDRYRQFAYGLFYGLMLVMALYNFFIFLSVKDRAYLYYVLYILSFTLFFSLLHGYLFFFLYGLKFETLYGYAPATALLTSLCSMLFARKFFLLKEEFTGAYKAVTALIVLHALAIPFSMLMHGVIPGIIGNILPMIAVVMMVIVAFTRMLCGFKPARYFLLAWSFLIAGVVIFVLQNLGLVAANFFTNNVAMIGASLETILLSFALGFRINSLMQAEEDARQELIREQQNKLEHEKRMSQSFARFVPREFLNYLNKESILQIERGEAIQKEMTVMFTDIRGFTTLAEKMGSESIFRLLNSYFERLAPIIELHGGFIDKFIGDAIMALFPDPGNAVRASIAMSRELDAFSHAAGTDVRLHSGCGLHTGELMLGTIGSESRLETTVIGDTVNLAARLESVTKKYGARVLISDRLYQNILEQSDFHVREIDSVFLKGKTRPVGLFQIFDAEPQAIRDQLTAHHNLFMTAMVLFRSGQLEQARTDFQAYARHCPHDPLGKLYLERIDELMARAEGIPSGWTGIYETW